MAFTHDSELAEREPDWSEVDKSRLPRAAFADRGEPGKKSTWRYPHHWVKDGAERDEKGIYTAGTLHLHRGGLAAAYAAAKGARSGQEAPPEVVEHLEAHRRAVGMGEQGSGDADAQNAEPAVNAEIPADVPEWVMIARTGSWLGHPQGPEVIERDHLESALAAFERNYRSHGTDLAIDYHHSSVFAARGHVQKAPAAGWIQDMELRNDGTELWARVLWTSEARRDIGARRYRYLSPVLRWNRPDPVTGRQVALQVHSVALTNTPFMTSLEALNQADADEDDAAADDRDGASSLLERLAEVLGSTPGQVARRLGVEADADDRRVARAVMALVEGDGRAVPADVANALGLDAGADASRVKAAILRLRAPSAGLGDVCRALGLPQNADEGAVLNAVRELQQEHHDRRAEELVDAAVGEGRIPPAHREFFLNNAREDYEATRMCLESMPAVVSAGTSRSADGGRARELTEGERVVCRQLGLTAEAFLNASE